MKIIAFFCLVVFGLSTLPAQVQTGRWVQTYSGLPFAYDYLQAVGGNCLIYYPSVSADSIFTFDTYSHQWHTHPFKQGAPSSNVFAAENAAMVWNDSLLVLFDAKHSIFHELRYDGILIHSGTAPYNLPGSIGSLTYILTTEKMYVYDQDTQNWSVYIYNRPGTGDNYGYAGNGKKDYVMIAVTNHGTSESKLIAFSKKRSVFDEITSTNLEWNILDHGFACWANSGIPEDDYFFTVYSANNGFMETIKPHRYFDTMVNSYVLTNDQYPPTGSTVFMASYFVPHDPGPGGVRHIYAADTRHSGYYFYTYEENNGNKLGAIDVGFEAGIETRYNSDNYEIDAYVFDGQNNSLIPKGRSVIRRKEQFGYYAGSSYFAAYDTSNLVFDNISINQSHTIKLPPAVQGFMNPTTIFSHADWAVATCHRENSSTVYLYSFNSVTDGIQSKEEYYYNYNFGKLKSQYFYYIVSDYNAKKKILVYAPQNDTWTVLPLAPDGKWFFGKDFICTYDKNDGNLKIHDVTELHDLAFNLGWNSDYDYDNHAYGKEKFFIASNSNNHYFGFSTYTRDIKEIAADNNLSIDSSPLNGMVALLYNPAEAKDFLTYNALSNSFIFLHLSDNMGNYRLALAGDSTALIVSEQGYLLAFDPGLKATGLKDGHYSSSTIRSVARLVTNYPNPFNPKTTIRYEVLKTGPVKLTVYNLIGQKIKTLVHGKKRIGKYSVVWDGRDESGHQMASGIFLYQLRSGDFRQTKKMMLIR